VSDRQDEVFVLCSDTSEAVVLEGNTGDELTRLDLPGSPSTVGPGQPGFFAADAEELYVVTSRDRLVRINTATNEVGPTLGPFEGAPIGAVGYDAIREELYVGRVPGFTEEGTVTIHERGGTQTGSFQAGVAPTFIDFRRSEE
jgi:DNA-binding beta-propeller fold protein YncE